MLNIILKLTKGAWKPTKKIKNKQHVLEHYFFLLRKSDVSYK